MTNNKSKKIKLWIPLLLFFINLILTSLLVEELIDATEPNYGVFAFLTPIIGLISFVYIRNFKRDNLGYIVRILHAFNLIFIIFPIAVILVFILAFI